MQDSNIKELTVVPTPEWVKELAKEITESYSLPYVERIFIAGIICKHLRKSKANLIMEFRSVILITLILAMSFLVLAIAVRTIEAAICIEPNRKLMIVAKTFFVGGICLGTLSVLLYFAYAIDKLI